jgi:hypothetical protein
LSSENNELLSEQRIFRDQVSPATCCVQDGVNDKPVGEWLGIPFDKLLPKSMIASIMLLSTPSRFSDRLA